MDNVEVCGNLNPINPYVHVMKDGGKVRSFRGHEAVARFCQTSLLSILELLDGVHTECESLKSTGADVSNVVPIASAGRFENIEF